jgi:hypothetical protein
MSDGEKQSEDGETKAEPEAVRGPRITIEGNPGEAFRKLPASVFGKPEIQAATRLGEAVKVATGELGSSISASAVKSFNDAAKNMFGGSSRIGEAMKFANVARGIVGKLDAPMMLPERPGLSADAMRWYAEKEAAPVATRDAVRALTAAVESLVRAQQRSDRRQFWIGVAILALTALIAFRDFF